MPKQMTKTYMLYTFEELSDKAKDNARDWFREASAHDDGAECTIEDAKQIGLRITGFDIDRGNYLYGDLIDSAEDVAKAITVNHGATCDTYKLALDFLLKIEELKKQEWNDKDDSHDYGAVREELEDEFCKALREDYLTLLRQEYEYQNSDAVVTENILANKYTFDENGKRCN